MEMITIKQIWKECQSNNAPMFGSLQQLSELDFMSEYALYFDRIDRRFMLDKQSYTPIWNVQEGDISATVADFQADVFNLLWSRKDRYSHLWAIRSVEYNPIYNVEEHTTNTLTDVYGEQNGQSSNNGSNSGEGNTFAFDSSSHVNNVDSSNTSSNSATSKTEEHTDTHTTVIERAGNIGVTSTMDLLTQEERYWSAFDFYKIIFEDISKELLILYDTGIDVF